MTIPVIPAGATLCGHDEHAVGVLFGAALLHVEQGVERYGRFTKGYAESTSSAWEPCPAVGAGPDTPTETRCPYCHEPMWLSGWGDVWVTYDEGAFGEETALCRPSPNGMHNADRPAAPPSPAVPGEPVPALPDSTVDVRPRSVDQIITENFNLTRENARLRAALAARPALPDPWSLVAELERAAAKERSDGRDYLPGLLDRAAAALGTEPTHADLNVNDADSSSRPETFTASPEPTTEAPTVTNAYLDPDAAFDDANAAEIDEHRERYMSGLPESAWADEERAAGLDYDDAGSD